MVVRKQRIPVVIDTNVFVRAFRARSVANPNQAVIRLWLQRRLLQLIVCSELVDEYLGIFSEVLEMDDELLAEWRVRFEHNRRSTVVKLGRRFTESRDPDDNLLLAAAHAGRAEFLLSNDRDLLELPPEFRRRQPFQVITPAAFVAQLSATG